MDKTLLLAINQGWASPTADIFFTWLSSQLRLTLPLGLLILAYWLWKRGRDGLHAWLLLALLVTTSDVIGTILKDQIRQPRPCTELAGEIRLPSPASIEACRGNLRGMPSNHALTFFAAAGFIAVVWPRAGLSILMFTIALLVALSRVYLAKHYPSQVLISALGGTAVGLLTGALALKYALFMRCFRHPKLRNYF